MSGSPLTQSEGLESDHRPSQGLRLPKYIIKRPLARRGLSFFETGDLLVEPAQDAEVTTKAMVNAFDLDSTERFFFCTALYALTWHTLSP